MKWVAVDKAGYETTYRSDCRRYSISHEVAGFGISLVRAYHRGERIGDYTGENGLSEAMAACGRHASPIAELDFVAGKADQR